ncbi:MAG TPA: FecR domain-containing protein [Chitinophagaceae bacterium]|jgi:ferric-dicitrate binding protein FerR (iron transport regulator)
MDKTSLPILADKVAKGTATEAELILYNQYYNQLQLQADPAWNENEMGAQQETEELLLRRISHSLGFEGTPKRIPLYRRTWLYAAAIVLAMLTGTLFFLTNKDRSGGQVARNTPDVPDAPVPGGNKATLTLADGSTVLLDNAQNGVLASQGNARVVKLNNGQLAYHASPGGQSHAAAPALNVLSTPRGGQYKLVLSDGSTVWLNAGSSLRFPAIFTGNERRVELQGEAYFEIARNTAMPFKVQVKTMEVTVLGTHFNIMGYDDEETIKTSLLQGTVKVQGDKAGLLLAPGQQSQLDRSGTMKLVRNANMDEAVAWKEGLFYFNGVDIQTVMRQLTRWYNVDVSYEETVDQHFNGKINRDADISKVLQMLELTEKVHFKMTGRKIIVTK